MGSSSIGLLRLISLFLILFKCNCLEWDASNIPNPTAGDYKRCHMRTTSNLCDPDEVLTDSQRYRLNHELHQLEARTRQDHAPDFCQKKGITAAMAIVKHIRGNSEEAVKEMANQILRKWSLDNQCQKSVVFVVATEDRRFWVARDPRVPVYAQEFTQIFSAQKQLFQQANYPQALGNIIQQTWEKAISKQGGAEVSGGGSTDDTGEFDPFVRPTPRKPDDDKKRGLLPLVPFWFWIVFVLIIVPVLCCCCCCLFYCCCCRKGHGTSSSPRRQGHSDIEGDGRGLIGEGGDGGRAGRFTGGRGGGFNNLLGGLGGIGLGHLAGQLLRGGDKRRNVPSAPGYHDGNAYPAARFQPGGGRGGSSHGTTTGGKGLYPTVAVRDEGGGGGCLKAIAAVIELHESKYQQESISYTEVTRFPW
uniref:TPM domain-containing protein n=1 Tax=Setaria digitata TaxID=48799 RepID=A0A915PRU2_9BILA